MPDIYETIRKDHERHRKLLDAIADTSGDSEKRRKCWNDFYYDVKAHAAAEEETFYSKIMAKPDGQDDARHSVAEHHEMDELMEELQGIDFSSPQWLQKFQQLKHDYEHHMDEEEEDIFKTARKVLTDDKTGEISDAFLSRKAAEEELVDKKARESLQE